VLDRARHAVRAATARGTEPLAAPSLHQGTSSQGPARPRRTTAAPAFIPHQAVRPHALPVILAAFKVAIRPRRVHLAAPGLTSPAQASRRASQPTLATTSHLEARQPRYLVRQAPTGVPAERLRVLRVPLTGAPTASALALAGTATQMCATCRATPRIVRCRLWCQAGATLQGNVLRPAPVRVRLVPARTVRPAVPARRTCRPALLITA
jgi:hypothetical protein